MRELADVGAGDERLVAGAGQDDAAHRSVVPRVLEGRSQILPGRRIQGVEHLGPIDGHIGDGALLLVQDIRERQRCRWRSGGYDCGRRRERCCGGGHVRHLLSGNAGEPAERSAGRAAPRHTKAPKPGDGLADDQILHLIRAFVGVERFAVRKEARDLVVGDDAVAAQQLAGPGDGLAALGRAERLGERRMRVRQLAFGVQLRLAHDQALRGRDVGDHLGEQILHQLERADRLAELQALLRVFERGLVGAHRASGRHPRHGVACHLQHLRGVAERVAALETVRFRHPNVLQRDVAVLDDLERDLVLDLLDAEAGRRLVLDDEALDLVVGDDRAPR